MGSVIDIWKRIGDLEIGKPSRTRAKCYKEPGEPQYYVMKHRVVAKITDQSTDFLFTYSDGHEVTLNTEDGYFTIDFTSRGDCFTVAAEAALNDLPLLVNHHSYEVKNFVRWRLKYAI